MAKKMLIDATHAEETRVVVVDGNKVEEFDFESENKRQLAGNIYLAKVTRVEPSLQAAFVDYGGNRHGFLAFSEIHPDYYQIPVADRIALMEEEERQARAEDEEEKPKKPTRSRRRSSSKAESARTGDQVASRDAESVRGMETIDLGDGEEGDGSADPGEGLSPMETVAETPVEEPDSGGDDAADAAAPAEDAAAPKAEAAEEADGDDEAPEAYADGGAEEPPRARADDDSIESVADDDTEEDIRPPRKARPRKYKIQEVIKVRQILLVQVVKEERGNKGAALTTYLSLAGRYCVLMPNTARGGGISRKITNAADRSKLKEIAQAIDVPKGAGLIIRTAGAKRTKTEIKRDYEYLQRLWEQIRELTLKSIAPAKIYEEGDLIKRSIRDLYNRDIDEVFVEGDRGYRIAKDFMKMIMPSHAKNVKHYADPMPLFARHQVESYLSGMFNPTVQLKSGGYIVIGVTEALVAIDVNSGRATKEGSIEETALKTNLEAAEEVARQLRLRDLAGLIVIDFIDMDERKNNAAVEKKLKDKLKTDRARIQVGRISGFGLLEMSRQRLRPGMIEATTQPCPACHGTGLIRSDDNMALQVLRQIEEEGVRRRSREVLVKCPVGIANFLINQKREHIAAIEMRYGMAVRVEGDPSLVSPDFSMEKFKTATRNVPEVAAPVVVGDAALMDAIDSDAEEEVEPDVEEAPEAPQEAADSGEAEPQETVAAEDEAPKPKKRRRRRRRKSKSGSGESQDAEGQDASQETAEHAAASGSADADSPAETEAAAQSAAPEATVTEPEANPAPDGSTEAEAPAVVDDSPVVSESDGAPSAEEVPAEPAPAASDSPVADADPVAEVETPAAAADASEPDAPAEDATPVSEAEARAAESAPAEPEPATEGAATEEASRHAATNGAGDSAPDTAEEDADASEETPKPKKRGWWSLGL
ncbi:Rne/Rng family ribonuclease [Roseivivax sediminis]|uniref:Ribonuclease E n=1 Tax=Roseivivax sediminis TaxID=936889 RepID=A0A1I1X8V3_9RHOB|nr:ribonuclease E/G [Roseivivax sediminis]SFE01780.1 RNAse E [Roseivivax sediminis]